MYRYRGRKILPIIAFVEAAIYFTTKGKDIYQVRQILKRLDIEIQPLEGNPADAMVGSLLGIGLAPGTNEFYKMWRDHSIAGHAHTAPLLVVTYNIKDFMFLGDRVLTPTEAMKRY